MMRNEDLENASRMPLLQQQNPQQPPQQQQPNSTQQTIVIHPPNPVQPSSTKMRIALLSLVIISVLCYIALIIWGNEVTKENPSGVKGLPTLSDMLAQSLPITAFYVVIVSLWGEFRIMWAVTQLLDPNRVVIAAGNAGQATRRRARICCTCTFTEWFTSITIAIAITGALQIMFLILLAVVPVGETGAAHTTIAGLVALDSIIRSSLLISRREAVYYKHVQDGRRSHLFASEHWLWVRIFSILNLFTMITSAIIFGVLSSSSIMVDNAAIAEYFLFFCFIIDFGFQIFDSPATMVAV
jgi:hypothetical protein